MVQYSLFIIIKVFEALRSQEPLMCSPACAPTSDRLCADIYSKTVD